MSKMHNKDWQLSNRNAHRLAAEKQNIQPAAVAHASCLRRFVMGLALVFRCRRPFSKGRSALENQNYHQPGQQGETTSLLKIQKLTEHGGAHL